MKIYVAGAWARKDEVRATAEHLALSLGVEITSHWLYDFNKVYGLDDKNAFPPERRAEIDLADIDAADVLVRFTDDLKSTNVVPAALATGARMWETGYAYARGKAIIVVGGHQPIFDWLPNINHVADVQGLEGLLIHLLLRERGLENASS